MDAIHDGIANEIGAYLRSTLSRNWAQTSIMYIVCGVHDATCNLSTCHLSLHRREMNWVQPCHHWCGIKIVPSATPFVPPNSSRAPLGHRRVNSNALQVLFKPGNSVLRATKLLRTVHASKTSYSAQRSRSFGHFLKDHIFGFRPLFFMGDWRMLL